MRMRNALCTLAYRPVRLVSGDVSRCSISISSMAGGERGDRRVLEGEAQRDLDSKHFGNEQRGATQTERWLQHRLHPDQDSWSDDVSPDPMHSGACPSPPSHQ